jgi:heme-degrading monooxygenase HmoA
MGYVNKEDSMSVMIGLRIPVDPKRFEEVANGNQERLMSISERAKQHGAMSHTFYASEAGDEVLSVDTWPDSESFQQFFSSSPDIGELMGEAGVTSEPRPVFWHEMDTPDKF